MSQIDILKAELVAGHPVTGAYSLDNAIAAAELNTVNRTLPVDTVTGAEIYGAVDTTEEAALTAGDLADLRVIYTLGDQISVSDSGKVRNKLVTLFGAGTQTRTNLVALKSRVVSRGEELGLRMVKPGFVEEARR